MFTSKLLIKHIFLFPLAPRLYYWWKNIWADDQEAQILLADVAYKMSQPEFPKRITFSLALELAKWPTNLPS